MKSYFNLVKAIVSTANSIAIDALQETAKPENVKALKEFMVDVAKGLKETKYDEFIEEEKERNSQAGEKFMTFMDDAKTEIEQEVLAILDDKA